MASIAVIGAGMAGMACAARLSVKGHDVHVFEKRETVGGQVSNIQFGEFSFETGPTYLTMPAVYRDLFLKTGAALEDEVQLIETPSFHRFCFTDGSVLTLPNVGVGACLAAISRDLGKDAADQWREYIKRCSDMWSATRSSLFETEPTGIWAILQAHKSPTWFRRAGMLDNFASFNRTHLLDKRLIELADFFAVKYGSDPQTTTASHAVIPYLEEALGAHHISGGVSELAVALHRRCVQLRVKFHFDSEITTIDKNHEFFTVTSKSGEEFSADIVVADSSMQKILHSTLLPELRNRKTQRIVRFLKKHSSTSEFVLLLGVSGMTPDIAENNVWLGKQDGNTSYLRKSSAPRLNQQPVYAHRTDEYRLSPSKGEAWRISVPAPLHDPTNGTDWNNLQVIAEYTAYILQTLHDHGIDLDERIQCQKVLTPSDFERSTGSPGGARFGTTSPSPGGLLRRPRTTSAIDGLYFVGSSTHPGAGLAFAAMSANSVATAIGTAQ